MDAADTGELGRNGSVDDRESSSAMSSSIVSAGRSKMLDADELVLRSSPTCCERCVAMEVYAAMSLDVPFSMR